MANRDDGILRLSSVQLEEDKPASPASVIRSVRVSLGLHPAELLERIHQLEARLAEVRHGEDE